MEYFSFSKVLQEGEIDETGWTPTMMDVVIDTDKPAERDGEENIAIANNGASTLVQATTKELQYMEEEHKAQQVSHDIPK